MARISIISAVAENRVIGKGNDLPWRLPRDFRYFKQMTLGKPCLMARRTFESLDGSLKGRTNIVLTGNESYQADDATVVHSIEDGLRVAEKHLEGGDEIMILGGATLYEAILPKTDRIYLTEVHESFEGDTYFPEINRDDWTEVSREDHDPDDRNPYPFSFVVLDRKPGH